MAPGTFTGGIPASWEVRNLPGFEAATPLGTWHRGDRGGRYAAGQVAERNVNRINQPNPDPDFAIIDSILETPQDAYLITPVVDLSNATEVFLQFEDETSPGAAVEEVLLSIDGGETFLDPPVFSYNRGAAFDPAEEPFYAKRAFLVPDAAGEAEVAFAFHYAQGGTDNWWAIDNVRVSANGPIAAPVRSCATRGFTVGEFDSAAVSVAMRWESIEGDEGYRVVRKLDENAAGEAISGLLGPGTTEFVDGSVPSGVPEVFYALETVAGGATEFSCTGAGRSGRVPERHRLLRESTVG